MKTELPHYDIAELGGGTIQAGGTSYVLDYKLGTGVDGSVSYRTIGGDYVVRVFRQERGVAPSRALRKLESSADVVVTYIFLGPARVHSAEGASERRATRRRGRRLWAAVRKYAHVTLKDVIRGPDTEVTDTYRMAIQLARGISALHHVGVYHGDIKPSNVVVEQTQVKLHDFGISTDGIDQEFDQPSRMFLSPESLWHGTRNDAAADWYSYGKLLRALYERSKPLHERQREVMWRLSVECLKLDPHERPSSDSVMEVFGLRKALRTDEMDLPGLQLAVYADLGSRVELHITGRHPKVFRKAIRTAVDRSLPDLKRSFDTRPIVMDQFELVHLLGTLSLLDERVRRLMQREISDYAILSLVLGESHERIDQKLPQPSLPEGGVDPEWATELEFKLREELTAAGLSGSEVESEVESQLETARNITSRVLHSESFIRSDDVAALMSNHCPGITVEEVRILRDMGYLVSLPVGDIHYYPLFQFDSYGMPCDVIKRVADLVGFEGSSWGRSLRWFMYSSSLREMSPAEWLRSGQSPDAIEASFASRLAA